MNHMLRLVVIVVAGLALLGGGLLVMSRAGTQPPVKWQLELNAYLSAHASTAAGPASVLAIPRVVMPSAFHEDLVVGKSRDGSFTALGYSVTEAVALTSPGDVWCVLLQGQGGKRQQVSDSPPTVTKAVGFASETGGFSRFEGDSR